MTERKSAETPTGLTPSNDTPQEKKRKVLLGRGAVGFLAAFAIAAFALYIFIAVYGLIAGT
ncbi:hypothetical protein J2T09_005308 [Neorhizobium huautlense]|uniref:Uncharacterized protein n=1 Tax=Neorhizobium huautlense TaxID=67774 RepID=A0ABT9Q1C4_9HYPH|nr:hypothetical protein [Neorhizobium huautlense]MDP9840521.1 hypothetical protein [Neorhizobium huautlense]